MKKTILFVLMFKAGIVIIIFTLRALTNTGKSQQEESFFQILMPTSILVLGAFLVAIPMAVFFEKYIFGDK
jgi:ABC-type phosphate transport system permease subunit